MSSASELAPPDAAALAAELATVRAQLAEVLAAVEALPAALTASPRPAAGFGADEDRALTTAGVQDALSIGRTKVYDLIADGHLKPVKLGNSLRFPVSQVRALIRRGTAR